MIKELRLIGWKSFIDTTLYIDPLTIIIGMNASGKSNVLDALDFLYRISSGNSISAAISGDAQSSGMRGGLEWVARKPGKELTLEVLIESSIEEKTDYRYSITISVDGKGAELASESLVWLKHRSHGGSAQPRKLFVTRPEEATTPGLPAYFYTASKGSGKRLDLKRSHSILTQVESLSVRKDVSEAARCVIEQLRRIFILDPIPSHMRNYSHLSENLQFNAANIAGVLAALSDERRVAVEKTITSYLKKLPERDIGRVWTERVGKFQTDAMLYCEENWTGARKKNIVDLRGMSDGTLRFLAIVTALLTRQAGSLLVVEEVDNGLHPSRASMLVQMLKELGREHEIDIIATTHNPALLDAFGSKMVQFISVAHRDAKTGASIITLLEDIDQLAKLMASGTIGRLTAQGQIEGALDIENRGPRK